MCCKCCNCCNKNQGGYQPKARPIPPEVQRPSIVIDGPEITYSPPRKPQVNYKWDGTQSESECLAETGIHDAFDIVKVTRKQNEINK